MTKPYLFPLKNTILWGLGLPLGLLSILAISYYLLRNMYYVYKRKFSFFILDTKYVILNMSAFWILLLFLYQGREFVKALRYFYPFYPFLALLSAFFIVKFYSYVKNKYSLSPFIVKLLNCFIVALFLIYPLSFMSIYTHLNTRIQASKWIYQNVPSGIYKSDELWDDGLPLSLENNIHENYTGVEFPLYNPDSPQKWQDMAAKLQQVNYIFETSNRLYASIMTVPEKYPTTNKYYQMLFDGRLGFEKVAEFTSRPTLPIPGIHICIDFPGERYGIVAKKTQECTSSGISFVDDYADETFTVYDHPKVTIFKKIKSVDYLQLLSS